MIQTGDRIPSVPVKFIDSEGTRDATSDEVLGQGRVVFFTVPGAFTPTCDTAHLPGFISNTGKLTAHGVDRIVCGAVNDHHVVKAWAERSEALDKIAFIADAHARLADAMGLAKEFGDLGKRFARCAMIVEDGVVQQIFVQDVAGVTVSGAPAVLLALEASKSTVEA
jgi:glutaredoxin/glutathione-dependent peroxiredoxin